MKRQDLGRALARKQHVTRAEAQDQVDALLHSIQAALREGRPTELPGIGQLVARSSPKNPTSPKNSEKKFTAVKRDGV
jgi:nucleoid DNA-binding protein